MLYLNILLAPIGRILLVMVIRLAIWWNYLKWVTSRLSDLWKRRTNFLFATHQEMCNYFKNTFLNQFRSGFNRWDTIFKSLIFRMERYEEVQCLSLPRQQLYWYTFMSTEIKSILNSTCLQIPPFPKRWNYSSLPTLALLSRLLKVFFFILCLFFHFII